MLIIMKRISEALRLVKFYPIRKECSCQNLQLLIDYVLRLVFLADGEKPPAPWDTL